MTCGRLSSSCIISRCHQQRERGHTAVIHDVIIVNDGHVNQWESTRMHLFGLFRIAEAV